MENINFTINDKLYEVSVKGAPEFDYGKNELLSTNSTDIAFNQEWYNEGYKAINFLNEEEYKNLEAGLTKSVKNIISSEIGIDLAGFELINYHHFVKTDEDHYKVVSKTRDLFPDDFNFPIEEISQRFENILGFKLTDLDPLDGVKLHIIVRINRPLSTDYNPPHKDIYEGVDSRSHIPQFINFWVPICGVTPKSSLPVAPSSHLLPENEILRTFEGGVVEGKKYRVRMIKEWGGSNALIRPVVNYGEVLFFSSHLVHGLAINEEQDQTRVALEFRLFKQN
jgi:Phytanoyl-CoA dioxygenase (PhyH)